jgi:hypothetical protein
MREQLTGFAGFIDGYKARNIAASASSIKFHFIEMKNALVDIQASLSKQNSVSYEFIDSIQTLINEMERVQDDYIPITFLGGDVMKTLFLKVKKDENLSILLKEEKTKKFVRHFLAIAEISEEKPLLQLALSLGELL